PHIMDDQLQVAVSDVYPYNRIHAPSSTLHSNVEDMLRWAQINLSDGQIAGNAIVKEATHKQLTSPQRKIGSTSNVCLGWFSSDFEGYRLVSHTGGDLGFRTFFGFIPEINMAVVTMTNSEVYPASNTASLIFRSFLLDEDYRAWQAPIHFALKDVLMQDGIEAFKKAFWEKKNGPDAEKYDCSPSKLDELGYALIDRGQFEPAVEVFKLAIEVDPENAAWYDSVADAYRAKGDKATATAWYEKALSINPKQKFSRDKLREMKKE
ncbi:MAG: serine hydrolase, partial [Bacteroidota bacterium]